MFSYTVPVQSRGSGAKVMEEVGKKKQKWDYS
jgi:hypothetical protein